MAVFLNLLNSFIASEWSTTLSCPLYELWIKFFSGLTTSTSDGFFKGTTNNSDIVLCWLNTNSATKSCQFKNAAFVYVQNDTEPNTRKATKKIFYAMQMAWFYCHNLVFNVVAELLKSKIFLCFFVWKMRKTRKISVYFTKQRRNKIPPPSLWWHTRNRWWAAVGVSYMNNDRNVCVVLC